MECDEWVWLAIHAFGFLSVAYFSFRLLKLHLKESNKTSECSSTPDLWNPAFVDNFDTFIFDCDGVVYRDSKLIPGVAEVYAELKSRGKRICFLTNSSSKSRLHCQKKIQALGLDVSVEQMFPASYITARHVAGIIPKGQKIFAIGHKGFYDELKEAGFDLVTPHDVLPSEVSGWPDLAALDLDKDIAAVVCGFDANFSYSIGCYAVRCIRELNAQLFFTHPDILYVTSREGIFLPGMGSIMGFFEGVLQYPLNDLVCGKPSKKIFNIIQEHGSVDPTRCLMVGDNLQTDIIFGNNCGIKTLLTFTGVADKSALDEAKVKPSLTISSLGNLFR